MARMQHLCSFFLLLLTLVHRPRTALSDCPELTKPENGDMNLGGYLAGDVTPYTCKEGYNIIGVMPYQVCQANDTWSVPQPTCEPKDCGKVTVPANGNVTDGANTYPSSRNFSCDRGHELKGDITTSCLATGKWSVVEVTSCTIKDCGNVTVPANGNVSDGNTTYGSERNISCETGYELKGDKKTTCLDSGSWYVGTKTTCTIKVCPEIAIPDGNFSGNRLFGDEVTVTCNTGYNITGTNPVKCLDTGKWSAEFANCTIVACPSIGAPTKGDIDVGTITYQSTATIKCDTGYDMVPSNSSNLTCLATGQWSGNVPECVVHDCGRDLEAPINGAMTLEKTTFDARAGFESRAGFTCKTGYELNGNSTLICTPTGWEPPTEPTCTLWVCPEIAIPNGNFTGNRSFDDEVTVTCNTGYNISGTNPVKCLDEGKWSAEFANCTIVACPSIGAPTKGDIDVGTITYQSTATIKCDTGYDMVPSNSSNLTCLATGQWSGNVPECVVHDCGRDLEAPINGAMTLEKTTFDARAGFESRAGFTCKTGYELNGNSTLICTPTGWEPPTEPTCTLWDCKEPVIPANAKLSSGNTTYLSKRTYSCYDGYEMVGTDEVTCNDKGNWSASPPGCNIVDCGQPSKPTDGKFVLDDGAITFNSTVTYSCNTGYDLKGQVQVTCGADKKYSSDTPECIIQDCGDVLPTKVDNGSVIQSGTTFNHTTVYTCDTGYIISKGVSTLTVTCQSTKLWDNTSLLACMRVDCEGLTAPKNGQVSAPITLYEEIAAYTCDLGYNMTGSHYRTCQSDAQWDKAAPECVVVDCNKAEALQNPNFGNVSTPTGTTYNQVATYTCNTGYKVTSGNRSRTCQADAKWDGVAAVCSIHNCGLLETVLSNGEAVQTGNTFNETTTYTCNTGYYITPDQSTLLVTCAADGKWDNTVPTCTPKNCGLLETVLSNGKAVQTGTTVNETTTYTCNTGYYITPNQSTLLVTCAADGKWDSTIPTCTPINCGNPSRPEFGQVLTLGGTLYNSEANYSCRKGYNLDGLITRKCQPNKQWEGNDPKCLIQNCDPLPGTIDKGQVDENGTEYLNSYIYMCDRGYYIEGTTLTSQVISSRTLSCTETGDWSMSVPVCVIIECASLQTLVNGTVETTSGTRYQSVANYTCTTGYRLDGPVTRTCQADAKWDGTDPACTIYDCNSLDNPDNGIVLVVGGTTYNEVAEYRCNEGYYLTNGDPLRKCQDGGLWEGEPRRCALYDCGSLNITLNSVVTLSADTKYGSRATYECDTGYYRSDGNLIRDCVFNNGWSGNDPVCTIHDCLGLRDPVNGNVTTAGGTTYSQVGVYTCDTGYYISSGSERRECQADGLWNGTRPICTLYECSSLVSPAGGSVTVSITDYGERADYTCNVGYKRAGTSTRMCMTGSTTWNGTQPTCRRQNCGGMPMSLANGKMEATGMMVFYYGDRINVTCDAGYLIAGTDVQIITITCLATGKWSAEKPTCALIECDIPDPLENGSYNKTGTGVGDTARFTCNEGYQLSDNSTVSCLDSGAWSKGPPVCTIYECGTLTDPSQGKVIVTKITFNGTATYICDNGYYISSGNKTRQCRDGGDWDGVKPICTKHDCGFLSTNLINGVAIQSGTSYEETTIYSCNMGYRISGTTVDTTTVICTANGTWSQNNTECEIVDCATLRAPDNGNVTLSLGTQYLSVASYSCARGFKLQGVRSFICQDNGQWGDQPPVCQLHDCGPLSDPDNGSVRFSQEWKYESVATYVCSIGYYINFGSQTRNCTDDGSWDGLEPTCADISTIACGFRNVDVLVMLSLSTGTTAERFQLAMTTVKELVDKSDIDTGSTRWAFMIYNTEPVESLGIVMDNFTTREALKLAMDGIEYTPVNTLSDISFALGFLSDSANWDRNRPDVPDQAILITDVLTDMVRAVQFSEGIRKQGVILNVVGVNIDDRRALESLAFSAAHVFQVQSYTELLQLPAMMFQHAHCDCGSLATPSNGLVDLSGGRYYLDEAVYSCNQGYQLSDLDPKVCQYDGNWNGTSPSCTEIVCGVVSTLPNGNMAVTGIKFEDRASFVCNPGYTLKGEEKIVCQANGTWSHDVPVCEAKVCGFMDADVLVIIGISPMMTSDDFNIHVKVAMKYIIGKSDLDSDRARFAFFFFDNDIRFGSIFDFTPRSALIERIDAIPFEPATEASNVTVALTALLGLYEIPTFGNRIAAPDYAMLVTDSLPLTASSLAILEVVKRSGIDLSLVGISTSLTIGLQNSVSGLNGVDIFTTYMGWIDYLRQYFEHPDCKCGALSNPAKGVVGISGTYYQDEATYSCSQGYELLGNNTQVCLYGGNWGGPAPVCIERDCDPVLAPENGIVILQGTRFGSIASFFCNAGFWRVGANMTICGISGWSDPVPVCEPIDCDPVLAPENGIVILQGTRFGSIASFVCNAGFRRVGANMTICGISGWSDPVPVCKPIECGQLSDPRDGTVTLSSGLSQGSVATYECNSGYHLEGSPTRQCVGSVWQGTEPSCEIRDCGFLTKPDNGNMEMTDSQYGAVVTFSCSVGFKLFGAEMVTCTQEGKWSDQAPMCQETNCGPPSNIDDGNVIFQASTFGQMANYCCNRGFTLAGPSIRMCQADEQWSGRKPSCVPIGCGSLSVTNGTVTFTDNSRFGSRARYKCTLGYYITGPAEKLCTAEGWSPATLTTCTYQDCLSPGRPLNGAVMLRGGTTYNQTAEFICDLGHIMVGSPTAVCLADGNWSALPPLCVITDCLNLTNPQDGSVLAPKTTFNQVANYTCNVGYTLTGISSRICMLNGSWSGQAPLCVAKDCLSHSGPMLGSVVFTDGTTFGKNAMYSCDEGYKLIGLSARVCGPNGTWVGDLPSCKIVDCGLLPVITNGRALNTTPFNNLFGSVLTYTCDVGFKLAGDANITCLSTGKWTAPPSCALIRCGPLEDLPKGTIDMSGGDTYDQTAIYDCSTGYKLIGNKIRTCTEQEVWSGTQPECLLIDCGELVAPRNGTVIFTGRNFGDSARYRCDIGHILVGPASRLCQSNEAWSESRPVCNIQDCKQIRIPTNGQRTLSSGTTYGSRADFSCDVVYDLIGPDSVVCQANGEWSGSSPTCVLGDQLTSLGMMLEMNLTIASTVDLENNATRDMFTAEVYQSLLDYYRSIMGSDVHDIVINKIKKGSVIVEYEIIIRNRDEAFVEFADASNKLADNSVSLTLFNTETFATTIEIDGTTVDLGVVNTTPDYLLCLGYIAAHGPCDERYICTVIDMVPSCQPDPLKECGTIMAPVNGVLEYPNGDLIVHVHNSLYGTVVIVKCNPGYYLVGDNTRSCVATGFWAPPPPECRLIDCGRLVQPENGAVLVLQGTSLGAKASYSCSSGYTLIGTVNVMCTATRDWSSPPPVCIITRCGTLTHPQNGNVSLSLDGQTAMYMCNRGYRLTGSSMRTCEMSGFWSGRDGQCEVISCGILTNPPNTRVNMSSGIAFGQTVSYSCVGPEYELKGTRVRACLENGTWDGSAPTCSLRDCGRLDQISNGDMTLTGTKYGDMAIFTCNNAYLLQGEPWLTCNETGWNYKQPRCIHIGDCGDLDPPVNGAVNESEGTAIGNVARYQCYTGYKLEGNGTRECLANSVWSGQPPECRIQTCRTLITPTGGNIRLSGGLTYGQTADYTCNMGYELTGPATITCGEDGEWLGITTCKLKDCEILSNPVNGLVDLVAGTLYGATATFTCNPGYIIKGSSMRKCGATGKWSLADPTCTVKDCGPLSTPLNGNLTLTGDTTFGNTASYSCNMGYNMTGSSQIQCGADGLWTGTLVVCTLKECPRIVSPSNSRITLTQGSYYGSIAIYACDVGYNMIGVHHNRTCMVNQLWSGTPPACVLVYCDILSAPLFGSIDLSAGLSYGSKATYNCSAGYAVDETAERMCGADGLWSGKVPSCTVVDCGELKNPKNGKVSMPQGTRYGRTADYVCNAEYSIDGAKTRICQIDGTWSEASPACTSGTNLKLAVGLGVGLSGFFIIMLVIILVAVIMYRRNIDRHESRMLKYGSRSKIVEVHAPVMPTTSYTLPVRTTHSSYLPYFRHGEYDLSETRPEYSNNSVYYHEGNLPREEYYTLRNRP